VRVLVDTGVWYAIYDAKERPQDRKSVTRLSDRIASMDAVVPWPVVYETMRTKFVKNKNGLLLFEKRLKSPKISLVDDAEYRKLALELSFNSSIRSGRPLSFVDCLLRLILDEANTKIKYLATYNEKDFSDVCSKRKIELMS
jgi:predicted nucleic acid-binding protein